jgi:hypothetical protein
MLHLVFGMLRADDKFVRPPGLVKPALQNDLVFGLWPEMPVLEWLGGRGSPESMAPNARISSGCA